jgi:thiol-disulfide isomerase/thioredoxin
MMTEPSNQSSPGRFLALILIGCGFVALGFAVALRSQFDSTAASSRDFLAVPSEVNLPSPELNLITLDGEPVSLERYRGNVVLVNLWATWCPPCREEMPTLQAFYDKYKEKGFVLVAINQGESIQEVQPFVEEFGMTFPVWLDPASAAGGAFNTLNLPTSYVIDRSGRIRLMWVGGISKKNLEKYVPAVIKEK